MMRATLLTEGGKANGLGHIFRCEAILQGMQKLQFDYKFIINGDSTIDKLNLDVNYVIQNWLEDFDEIVESSGDVVIIDSYIAGQEILEVLASAFKIAVFMDDYNRLDYPTGIIINSAIAAENLNYKSGNGREFLLGPFYHPMRSEFWVPEKKVIRQNVEEILITLGGADMKNLTPSILQTLSEIPAIKKNIVIGKGFTNTDQILNYMDSTCHLINFPDAGMMQSLMRQADLAISASGQTLYELAMMGVPTIAVAVADNQALAIEGWLKSEFIEFAGWWDDPKLYDNIIIKLDQLMDHGIRAKKSLCGQKKVDGSGALRTANYILNKLEMASQ